MDSIKRKIIQELNNPIPVPDAKHYSISSILDQIKPEFNKEAIAAKTSAKYFNDKESKYYQKTPEEIVEMWSNKGDYSINSGKSLDDYIGMVLNNEDTRLWELDNFYDDTLKHKCSCAKSFITKMLATPGMEYITRENKVCVIIKDPDSEEWYIINGRFDALFSYIIDSGIFLYLIDWKNNESIEFTNNYYLNGPCRDYPNANGYVYAIQLAFYSFALRDTYGINYPVIQNIVQFPSTEPKVIDPKNYVTISDERLKQILLYGIKKIQLKKEMKNSR